MIHPEHGEGGADGMAGLHGDHPGDLARLVDGHQIWISKKLGNVEKEIQWSGKPMRIKVIADDFLKVLFNYIKNYGETFIPESTWKQIQSIWSQNTQY